MNHQKEISFTKMTGAGNDFILIDLTEDTLDVNWSQIAPKLCNRRYGIGADGLLVIGPSKRADFVMNYFNADGSYGGMCGNGGRCVARYFFKKFSKTETTFEALDYLYHASLNDIHVKLQMKNPIGFYSGTLNIEKEVITFRFIDTGTAHIVIFMEDIPGNLKNKIQTDQFNEIGRQIRNHSLFAPGGANVNFIEFINNSTISMRTYERGVEEETLACGTGAVASAIVTAMVKHYRSPVTVLTQSKEILEVAFQGKEGTISDISLSGTANEVFRGTVKIEF